eukprot:4407834-Pleurochrysis_carterae.AAC.1
MNDIVHRGPACSRVLALLPRTRTIAWHHGDTPDLMLTVCSTMWCTCISTPSHSVSTTAVVRVDRLNSHAHSSLPATVFSSPAMFSLCATRHASAAEPRPLNSSEMLIPSLLRSPAGFYSTPRNSASSWTPPAFSEERSFTFAFHGPAAPAAARR